MALELPETTLTKIREGLTLVGKDLDQSIIDQNLNLDVKEDNRKEVWNQNVISSVKTDLTSDEKTRFINISKLFVNEWMEQIKLLQEEQEKKAKLTGDLPLTKPDRKIPYEFLSDLMSKRQAKKPEPPKPKKKASWLKKILMIIGSIALGWAFYKTVLAGIPGKVWESIKDLGSEIADLAVGVLSIAWEGLKTGLSELWDWIKDALNLDAIGEFFSKSWETVSGWLTGLWNGIVATWETVKNFIVGLPGAIWDWICDAANAIFQPIIDAISAAWHWLCDGVIAIWDWICEQINSFWEGLKSAWTSIVNFFSGIWDWITDTFSFSKIWGAISDFFSSYINGLKEDISLLLEGKIFEFIQNRFKFITDMFSKAANFLSGWWSGDNKESVEKKKEKTEIKKDVKKVIEKQEDIVLKDNVLETVKSICDRINVFFSGNSNGFIDLSNKLIGECQKGFQNLFEQFNKIKLNNTYNIEQDLTFRDTYDQSDKSVKTINNDYSKVTSDDYSITYNTIDIPGLNKAISVIEQQSATEIRLLESQNDYLVKMINNIDGLGDKLEWLDSKNNKEKPVNNIIPIIGGLGKSKNTAYETFDLKVAQANYANALG